MNSLPNFKAVTLDEAIEWADTHLVPQDLAYPTLGGWVEQENALRESEQSAFEAQPVVIDGVTLLPGDTAHLTVGTGYRGDKPKRRLNCVITGQAVRQDYSGRRLVLRYTQYGAKAGGYPQPQVTYMNLVTKAVKVEKPDWITADEQRRKERGW